VKTTAVIVSAVILFCNAVCAEEPISNHSVITGGLSSCNEAIQPSLTVNNDNLSDNVGKNIIGTWADDCKTHNTVIYFMKNRIVYASDYISVDVLNLRTYRKFIDIYNVSVIDKIITIKGGRGSKWTPDSFVVKFELINAKKISFIGGCFAKGSLDGKNAAENFSFHEENQIKYEEKTTIYNKCTNNIPNGVMNANYYGPILR